MQGMPGPATRPLVYGLKAVPIRPIQVLDRGDVKKPGQAAKSGALSCVSGLSAELLLSNPAIEGHEPGVRVGTERRIGGGDGERVQVDGDWFDMIGKSDFQVQTALVE